MAYIKGAAEDTIARISKMFPVLLVTGPRQVGKTTLLQKLAETERKTGTERKYVTLDDPDARYLAKRDPALFLQRYSPPVWIDEIQYATELFPSPIEIKKAVSPGRAAIKNFHVLSFSRMTCVLLMKKTGMCRFG